MCRNVIYQVREVISMKDSTQVTQVDNTKVHCFFFSDSVGLFN